MVLKGLPLIRIQQNGRMLMKVTIAAIVIALSLSGCSIDWWVGDGRGDWILDLQEGYAICKINSERILFVHKENPDDSGGTIVLPNFFVMAYQQQEQYVCLKGICTQKESASKDEPNDMGLSYYLVDTINDEVFGPFESSVAFAKHCSSLEFEINDEWIKPKK
jgi:hypothetical protein